MDRDCVSKIVNNIRRKYPEDYKGYDIPKFKELADIMEQDFKNYPNDVVEKEYEKWFASHPAEPPRLYEIVPVIYATTPSYPSNNPSTWKHYIDEERRYIVIPPKGTRCYEEINKCRN